MSVPHVRDVMLPSIRALAQDHLPPAVLELFNQQINEARVKLSRRNRGKDRRSVGRVSQPMTQLMRLAIAADCHANPQDPDATIAARHDTIGARVNEIRNGLRDHLLPHHLQFGRKREPARPVLKLMEPV